MDFDKRTKLASKVAKKSGKMILKMQSWAGSTTKGVNDVVTAADYASEKLITDAIIKHFPEDGIIAEEGSNRESKSGYTWVIDPLDGTLNYSRGLFMYGVSVGYLYESKPAGGAVYFPKFNELFVAEKGKGAYLNGKQIHVSENGVGNLTTGLDCSNRHLEYRDLHFSVHNILVKNSFMVAKLMCSVAGICYTACGRYDAYMCLDTYLWDISPSGLILEEAGGRVSKLNGQPVDYLQQEGQFFVGTNQVVCDEVIKLVKHNI